MALIWPCHKFKEKDMQAKANQFLNNNKQLKIQLKQTRSVRERNMMTKKKSKIEPCRVINATIVTGIPPPHN